VGNRAVGFLDLSVLPSPVQAASARSIPGVFLVSTLDGGDPVHFAIHSPFKEHAGLRAALGLRALVLKDGSARYLGPRAVSASASTIAAGTPPLLSVSVIFDSAGMYGSPLLLNSTVTCPVGLDMAYCESFAVLTSDCLWRSVERPGNASALTPSVSGNGSILELTLTGAPDGLTIVAVRNGFAPWPLPQLTNSIGTPADPFELNVTSHNCPEAVRYRLQASA
jgi:hypothetical protein